MRLLTFCLLIILTLPALQGCGLSADEETAYPLDTEDRLRARRGKLTGDGVDLLNLGGGGKAGGYGSGIGVNAFLWRASLDTLSFMPLAQVDPHGGVIITDWYENPDAPGERFKLNVTILGTELRSDGVRVAAFRQKRSGNGWRDVATSSKLGRQMEDAILQRARELRIQSR